MIAGSSFGSKPLKLGALIVAAIIALSGCGSSTRRPAAAPPLTTVAPTSTSSTTGDTTTATGPAPRVGHSVTVSVQSDAAMRAAGNNGPSSSILVPSSCTITSSEATATGTYQGGIAPLAYERYGDRVDLYVFSAPLSGYPEGIQLASPFTPAAPVIGGKGPWTVTVPLDSSLLQTHQPVRCIVAAQPTEDFEGAPSAY